MSMIASKTSATTVTFANPQEVVISHLDDSIKIGDGTQVFTGGTKAATASLPITLSTEDKAKLDALLTEIQLKADLTETQPVSVASLPLPSGAATSALQTTGNTTLTSIDTELNTITNELNNIDLLLITIYALLDNSTGDSIHVNGSIGTTPASIPAVAGDFIRSFFIENTHATQTLYFSVDAGVTWKTVNPSDAYTIQLINKTQIQIKASGASTTYESIFNRKPG